MLLLIGFEKDEIEKIKKAYPETKIVGKSMSEEILEEILKNDEEDYEKLGEQRITIMHEIPKEKISEIMKNIRQLAKGYVIFATSTPTSLQWKISDLIDELIEEDKYFREQGKIR